MKSSSASEIHRNYFKCFICLEWGWDVHTAFEADLCLPCYVDVLEVRQRRGVLGSEPVVAPLREGPDKNPHPTWRPGLPLPYFQIDMFEKE